MFDYRNWPRLDYHCSHLKSHLFSRTLVSCILQFWLFSHLYSARTVTMDAINRFYVLTFNRAWIRHLPLIMFYSSILITIFFWLSLHGTCVIHYDTVLSLSVNGYMNTGIYQLTMPLCIPYTLRLFLDKLCTGWAKKSKPDNFCNNFVYCQPICIFLAHVHCRKFATGGWIVSPPNMVNVTALPCKISTLPICLYMFTTINNNKYKNICTLDMKKRPLLVVVMKVGGWHFWATWYTGWAKKVSLINFAITLSTASQFAYFWHIYTVENLQPENVQLGHLTWLV